MNVLKIIFENWAYESYLSPQTWRMTFHIIRRNILVTWTAEVGLSPSLSLLVLVIKQLNAQILVL